MNMFIINDLNVRWTRSHEKKKKLTKSHDDWKNVKFGSPKPPIKGLRVSRLSRLNVWHNPYIISSIRIHGFAILCPKTKDLYIKLGNFYFIRIFIFRAAFHIEFRWFEGWTTLDDACQFHRHYKCPNIILMVNNNEEFRIWHMVTQKVQISG